MLQTSEGRAAVPMQQTTSTAQMAPAARVLHALALLLVCLLLAWCSIVYTRVSGSTSLVWMNNGLLVGLLVLRPRREWTELLAAATLASVIARAACGDALGANLIISLANVIECLLVAGAARWHTTDV